jgi:hypothetical protein
VSRQTKRAEERKRKDSLSRQKRARLEADEAAGVFETPRSWESFYKEDHDRLLSSPDASWYPQDWLAFLLCGYPAGARIMKLLSSGRGKLQLLCSSSHITSYVDEEDPLLGHWAGQPPHRRDEAARGMQDVLSRRQLKGLQSIGVRPGIDLTKETIDLVSSSRSSSVTSSLTSTSRSSRGRAGGVGELNTPHPQSGKPPLKHGHDGEPQHLLHTHKFPPKPFNVMCR